MCEESQRVNKAGLVKSRSFVYNYPGRPESHHSCRQLYRSRYAVHYATMLSKLRTHDCINLTSNSSEAAIVKRGEAILVLYDEKRYIPTLRRIYHNPKGINYLFNLDVLSRQAYSWWQTTQARKVRLSAFRRRDRTANKISYSISNVVTSQW